LPDPHAAAYAAQMEARVAVLEQIAKDTEEILVEMKQDIRDIRGELTDIRKDQKTDFRLLFGALISVALGQSYLMAHGFHWL
jgi:hypothetical protein